MIWPKEYLSYSQYMLWKRSPDKYIELYLRDGRKFTSQAMEYGKMLAESIEHDEDTGNLMIDYIREMLPKLDTAEKELRCTLTVGKDTVPLMGKVDHAREDLTAIKEYKTGTTKWTQSVVDRDIQLTWYATMIYIIKGFIVPDIELCHAPTELVDGTVRCTGEIRCFKTQRKFSQILNMMAEMRKVWREIGERCELELLAKQ